MKKVPAIGVVLVLITCLSLSVYGGNQKNIQTDELKEAQSAIRMIEETNPVIIGEIAGEDVDSHEFLLRYAKAVGSGSDNPYEETVEALKMLKTELRFVKDHDIQATEQDILTYTEEQRYLYENEVDPELKAGIKSIIDTLGLTEDEYWEEYKIDENTKYLNHINALTYLEENGLSELAVDNVEFKLTNNLYKEANFVYD